ncbi:hypothetical protein [Acinetobacter junii]|jgi:hypothetical protein|uniref:hypothetical protein n=1 Tax=Acinetobacter junii TaxID=40215 RepID=UPI00124ECB7E|nr:hypothetical protein [Acinetobacter junii]
MQNIDLEKKINQIKTEIIAPQQLGKLTHRLSVHQKFVAWHNHQYETNWFCLSCKKDDETLMDPTTSDDPFEQRIIQCQKCGIRDQQGLLSSTRQMDKKAWESAQSIVTFGMSPEEKKRHEKRSWERFERIKSGKTTLEDEEAVLLMQWRALNNLPKN